MFAINSSRAFRLLCWAIGLLAVLLLAMVGMMVYPLVSGQKEGGTTAAPDKARSAPKAAEAAVVQAARSWTDRFWPVKQETVNAGFDANAVDSFSGYRFIGSILKGEGKGYAILQREGGDMGQLLVRQDDPHSDIKIRKLSKDLLAIQVGAQKATLRKVEAGVPRVAGPRRPSGPSAAPQTGPSVPLAPPMPTASTSRRLASMGATSASSTSATVAVSTGPAPSASPSAAAGVNWRQYWSDRIRRQQDQAGQRR